MSSKFLKKMKITKVDKKWSANPRHACEQNKIKIWVVKVLSVRQLSLVPPPKMTRPGRQTQTPKVTSFFPCDLVITITCSKLPFGKLSCNYTLSAKKKKGCDYTLCLDRAVYL